MEAVMQTQQKPQYPWLKHYTPGTHEFLDKCEYLNIPDMIVKNSKKWAQTEAYTTVLPNGFAATLKYQDIANYSDDFAVYLKEVCRLNAGDRVAIQLPNCIAYPISVFGVFKAGCVVVNTNPLYTPSEMLHQFSDSGAKVLVVIDAFADKVEQILTQTKIEHVILVSVADFFNPFQKLLVHFTLKYVHKKIPSARFPHKNFTSVLKTGNNLRVKSRINTKKYWGRLELKDIAVLQYTGGTTGISKGAMLTHENLLANMHQIIEMGKQQMLMGKETILTAIPLYHIFAFTLNLITFYGYGGKNILIPNPRPIKNMQKAFENYKISWISGVNTLFNALLNEPWFQKNPPKYLKAAISGGAALHLAVAEKWLEVTKAPIVSGFGLTEASPVVTFNTLSDFQKPESVGIPVPSTEVAILDESFQRVPTGMPGEVAVKGPQVMVGYWNNQAETAKVFHDGWLLTGDIGVMDEDGYLTIVDRKKDMILVSGFNVYPNEIENCLTLHPGIQEAAVVGVQDKQSGECVKAFIVKRDQALTEDDVIAHCQKYLTGYKIPRIIEFKTELPKTAVGKVLRKNLRVVH